MNDKTLKNRVDKFLNSRRSEEVKQYASDIIKFLSDHFPGDNQGWVRAKDIQFNLVEHGNIPSETQLYRLLDAMTQFNIIERMEGERDPGSPGKHPIYYRLIFVCSHTWFMPRDELLDEYNTVFEESIQRDIENMLLLRIIRKIMDICTQMDISEIFNQERDEWFSLQKREEYSHLDTLYHDGSVKSVRMKQYKEIDEIWNTRYKNAFAEIEKNLIKKD